MEARIPFSGFYETKWSEGIDEEENRYAEELAAEYDVPMSEVAALLFRHTKYHDAYRQVARDYVPSFSALIDVPMTYKDMTSPREYNFETDRVFVEVAYKDMLRLARRVGRKALRKAAKDMFTSRSGFISFYDADIARWGPLRGWDHNQLYCLLTAAVDALDEEDWDWSIYEDFLSNGDFSNAFHGALDSEALMLNIGKLVGRRELREELEESDDDGGKRFPVAWSNTADYVNRYNAMNPDVPPTSVVFVRITP
ncbi:hypothetical protein CKO18_07620 [Rhodoferax fermentans]|uniref:Uncharacterized protein n=3 Tax=Rhodoferax fermentans TaxID=28066 RepID=A0A1T1ANV7_RHOFE|nr:hypothetical protein [Rhodoferax fermentans]OOV05811.1 hypothetical protein RF819_02975 [Rhodoferax fermentans]